MYYMLHPYVIDYAIATLFLAFTLLVSFLSRRTIKTKASKFFGMMIYSLITSSALNIITVLTLDSGYKSVIPVPINYVLYIFYYLLVSALPMIGFFFIISSIEQEGARNYKGFSAKLKNLFLFPIFISWIFTVITPITKLLFYFDENGVYHLGKGLFVPYVVGALYLFSSIFYSIHFRNLFPRNKKFSIIFYVAAAFFTIVFQFSVKNVLIVEFISTISVMIIYLSLENPQQYRDLIPGLFNLTGFSVVINSKLNNSNKEKFQIIAFQIGGLRYLNETIGDDNLRQLLSQVSNIVGVAGDKRRIFRISTTKFAFIIPDDNYVRNRMLDRLQSAFTDSFRINDTTISLSIRLVTMSCPTDADNLEDILDLLLNSLDKISNDPPGTIIPADKSILAKKQREDKILLMLREALMKNQFYVVYQPIYSIEKKAFTTAEALVRLKNNELGEISPEEFIPIAERNGMVLEIGDFVFKSVCKFIINEKIWEKGIDYIHVNLSVIQCMQESLSQQLFAIMDSYKLNYKYINLEITETSAIISSEILRSNMNSLLQKNVRFSLDDFGSGFSNTSSLIKYPFQAIKLDKTFINAAIEDKKAMQILHNTIQMIKSLNMDVIAEGIETEEQASLLVKLGCNYIQGYYYSRPVESEKLLELLNKNDR